MDITVTGRKMTVSDALRSYVEEKLENSVKVFNISPMSAEVVLRKEKNPANPKPAVAEVTLFTKGHIIRAEEAEEDMYAAIDVAAAKAERQLRKYKTRVLDRRTHDKKLGEVLAQEEKSLTKDEHAVGTDDNEVVRMKEIDLVALTEQEAMLQIDLLGHDFFVYSDDATGLANVMYRRRDGSYGILRPRAGVSDPDQQA
ncbi:MAG: ribosome-associated translation inhibitor RaiA [Coriobacteriales bacterium]|jgi:putative sigma-54 modulation protein|nr:ribosome-associated translation inhibitor RaiA [Coriobacteriales bacterium]